MSSIQPPEEWRGRTVYTLDILMFVRDQILEGVMPEMFFGRTSIDALAAFIHGITFTLYCQRVKDEGYFEFVEWLRDVKGEFPAGGGWAKKSLEACEGDHRAAIERFLGFVAEFVALRGPVGERA